MECRKHNHQGNRGVCPSCLRDKLSRLPNTTSYYVLNRSDPSSSSSTTVSSPPSWPAAVKDHHRRAGSMSMSFAVREALSGNLIEALGGGLKKSRSMAHVPKDSYIVRDSKKKKSKTTTTTEKLKSTTAKKTGFWTKLLHLKGKGGGADAGGLVTSRQRVY
ncbi:hypothetical protein EUTSA_v10005051mg [Eutrema salsugineum]|uniref:Uncharacterized protein n=1 Tax=Eutrema salsugineum TaxID=72664 RepID=V4K0G1_EUTSA|nr:uncharacterized protein LOC18013028 [Eutrema salsugineum]ESQ31335.1 hypothetical protein EUTSA_v10005051mg [Eutrema salsugineum]